MVGLRILGPRVLARTYELPEKSDGGIILPDSYRNMFDGRLFEIVAVGDRVKELLCVVCGIDDKQVIGLRSDMDAEPLELQPDDIIQVKGTFGSHSPEMSAFYGYSVWFLDVIQNVQGREKSTIEWVWPSKNWKENDEAA